MTYTVHTVSPSRVPRGGLESESAFFELDDIIHNTLGAAVGIGLWVLIRKALKR